MPTRTEAQLTAAINAEARDVGDPRLIARRVAELGDIKPAQRRWLVPIAAAAIVLLAIMIPFGPTRRGSSHSTSAGHRPSQPTIDTPPGTLIPVAQRVSVELRGDTILDGFPSIGTAFSLPVLDGQPVVVSGLASWCGPCATSVTQLNSLRTLHSTTELLVVGLDVKDTEVGARQLHSATNFTLLTDPDGSLSAKFGEPTTTEVPFTALIDRQGRIAAVYLGTQQTAVLTAAVNDLISN